MSLPSTASSEQDIMIAFDDDFEDLLDEGEVRFSSQDSQTSLVAAATDLAFCESDEEMLESGGQIPADILLDGGNVCLSKRKQRENLPATCASKPKRKRHAATKVTEEISNNPLSPDMMVRTTADSIDDQVKDVDSETPEHPVIRKINAVFEQIADDILSRKMEIGLSLNMRPRVFPQSGNNTAAKQAEPKTKRICFPGKTAREAWRFTVIVRILELIHEALRTGVTLSKRDIYYRDPALFGSQTHVDRYVDDIAFTFAVPRSSLNITAVAKGLLVGALTFCRRDGSILNARADREGILVLNLKDVLSVHLKAVKWIIVIEKEASFRSLAASSFWDRLSTEGVLVTGKGYPDIATRALLHFLCTPSPQNGFASPPAYALVDFDPDGLAIMSVYKHGSIALAHESAELRVPQMKWLGLRSENMLLGGESIHVSQGLLTLTARDRNKAKKMLERSTAVEQREDDDYVRELQVMLMLNVKAELQLLDAEPDGMSKVLGKAFEGMDL